MTGVDGISWKQLFRAMVAAAKRVWQFGKHRWAYFSREDLFLDWLVVPGLVVAAFMGFGLLAYMLISPS